MTFKDKSVWITGGGSGIGEAIAIAFAREGALVAVSGRREAKLLEVAKKIDDAGGRGLAVVCDVTNDESVERAVQAVVAAFGGLDVSIANAGFSVNGKIAEVSTEDWRRQLDTNVIGLASTIRASLPHLTERKGRMVLIGSVMSMMTVPSSGAYSASKYAVRAIGQTLSMELAGTGVSCSTIYPGFVSSEIGQVDNRGVFHENKSDPRPQKFMWSAEDAAKVTLRAIRARRREYTFTNHGKVGAFVGRHAPWVMHQVLSRAGKTTRGE